VKKQVFRVKEAIRFFYEFSNRMGVMGEKSERGKMGTN
jgi:hypothetical protein